MMKPPATGIHKGKPREKKKYAIPHGNCKLLSAKPRRCLLSLSHPQADNFRADKQTPSYTSNRTVYYLNYLFANHMVVW